MLQLYDFRMFEWANLFIFYSRNNKGLKPQACIVYFI